MIKTEEKYMGETLLVSERLLNGMREYTCRTGRSGEEF
jgi:hypothetical protein